MTTPEIEVRQFTPDEWRAYKAVRLKALQSDPSVFGSSYAREADEPDEKWVNTLTSPDVAVFGVFRFGDVIGMTGIVLDKEDRSTAKLWGSWLEPKWRGKGLSERMYKARLNWAQNNPLVKRITVSHRQSNTASKGANQKHGFKQTHISERTWPDGVTEADIHYELVLKK